MGAPEFVSARLFAERPPGRGGRKEKAKGPFLGWSALASPMDAQLRAPTLLQLSAIFSKGLSIVQWIFTGIVQWIFSDIFQRILTCVRSGV